MKIIRNFTEWCDEALTLLKDSKYCYVASFNINFAEGDKVYQIIQQASKMDHKLLIGLNTMVCKPNCQDCLITNNVKYRNVTKLKEFTDNYRIVQDLHMKLFLTSKGFIVGGMNITGSGWTDRSFVSHNKENAKELLVDFLNVYHTAKDYELKEYIDITKIFTFGKYKGKLIADIKLSDPKYLIWLQNNGGPVL